MVFCAARDDNCGYPHHEGDEMSFAEVPQREASGGPTREEQVLAAQIRVKLDRQDKIPTPTWIVKLADSATRNSES